MIPASGVRSWDGTSGNGADVLDAAVDAPFGHNGATVLGDERDLDTRDGIPSHDALKKLHAVSPAVRVNVVEEGQARDFLFRVTERSSPGLVDIEKRPIGCDALNEVVGVFKQIAIPLFAFPQRLLRRLSLGHVTDDRAVSLPTGYGELQRKLRAVFPAPVQGDRPSGVG